MIRKKLARNGRRTERDEREDKVLSAVDATVASRIVQRVGHGAAVAEREEVLCVLIGLSTYAQGGQIHALLELRRRFEILE